MDDAVSEVLPLVGMEDYLCSFLVGKRWTRGDELLIDLNSPRLLLLLVPDEQPHFLDIFKGLAQVILVHLFALALVEVALDRVLLDLRHIDPSAVVLVVRCLAEHIVLQHLLVLVLGEDAVEGLALFDSPFLVVEQALDAGLDGSLQGQRRDGVEDFFGVLGVCVGRGEGVVELEEARKDGDLGRRRIFAQVFFEHLQDRLHSHYNILIEAKRKYKQNNHLYCLNHHSSQCQTVVYCLIELPCL